LAIDKPKIHSAIIILCMFFFFPAGIVLLLVRFAAHYKHNHLRARDYRLVGHSFVSFYALIAFIIIIAGSSDPEMSKSDISVILIVFGILFLVPGGIFYLIGTRRQKKMSNLYNLYYHLTTVEGIHSIDRIAELSGESSRNVTQDLSYMITTGRLSDAWLDPVANVVMMGNRTARGQSNPAPLDEFSSREDEIVTVQTAATSRPVAQSITCSGCGASSRVVPGEGHECEFCGNSLFIPL